MKKFIALLASLHIFSASTIVAADDTLRVNFVSSTGTTEFRATGHPSALHVVGKGTGPTGQIFVDNRSSSGQLSFDLKSLDTGIDTRDEHMKTKYLEVDKYPTAQLTISNLPLTQAQLTKPLSVSDTPFRGTLLLHGVSKPVNGSYSLRGDGHGTLKLDSKFGIKLSDFGIAIPTFSGITIADQVQIHIASSPQFKAPQTK